MYIQKQKRMYVKVIRLSSHQLLINIQIRVVSLIDQFN
jgi:hypothetical protein